MELKSIALNQYNEELTTSYANDFAIKLEDSGIYYCFGAHGVCTGTVDIISISKTHMALRCRKCIGRIFGTEMPKEQVETVGQLRQYFESALAEQRRRHQALSHAVHTTMQMGSHRQSQK